MADIDSAVDRIRVMQGTARGIKPGERDPLHYRPLAVVPASKFEVLEAMLARATLCHPLDRPRYAGKPDAATTLLVQECIQLLTLYSDFSEVVRSHGRVPHKPRSL